MALKTCIKCGRVRSSTYMQEAVFRTFGLDEGVDIWKCNSTQTCKKARKERKPTPKQHDRGCELTMGYPDVRCTCESK